MKDIKTSILFSALFNYNGTLRDCIDYIKNTYCIKSGYSLYGKDCYIATVTIFENKADNPNNFTIIVDIEFYETPYYALLKSCRAILAYILIFIMERNFKEVVDVIKNNNAVDGATLINKFINENETYYDVKNVIETAIKNNDIDIEKLCESLNI